jgi:hypothetical protein
MNQTLLKFYNPIFHKNDPVTSQEAVDDAKRGTNAAKVLDTVRALPGLTGTELAKEIPDLTLTETRRRLTDLLHRNLVRQGEKRGRELEWWPNS